MWISLGTMMKLIYDQFSGVQVIEVLNDHIILTFCIHQPRSQFFSIILTRNPNSISVDVRFFLATFFTFTKHSIDARQFYMLFYHFRNCRGGAIYLNFVVYKYYRLGEFAMHVIQCTAYQLYLFLS